MKKKFSADNIECTIKLTESISDDGNKYKCVFIKAGKTKSANKTLMVDGLPANIYKNYTWPAIQMAITEGVFEGAPVLFRKVTEHLNAENTSINTYVGYLSGTHCIDDTQEGGAVFNVTEINESAKNFKINLSEAFKNGNPPELSISAGGEVILEKASNGYIANVERISSCQSVDVVPSGNAGGRFIELIESQINLTESFMNPEIKQKIFDLLFSVGLIAEGKTVDSVSSDDLLSILWNHVCTLSAAQETSLTEAQKVSKSKANLLLVEAMRQENKTANNLLDEMKLISSNNSLSLKLTESALPVPVQDKIKKQYAKIVLTEAGITSLINDEKDALAALNPNYVDNGRQDIRGGEDQVDKIQKALIYTVMPSTLRMKLSESERAEFKDVAGHHSFKEIYRTFTGDNMISGKLGKMSLAESIDSTTWTDILGVAMNRTFLLAYRTSNFAPTWKKFVKVVSRTDFKDNTLTRKGGYGDLPVVAEGAVYTDATTPGQEKLTYALLKHGYIETVTMEAIANDDLGAIQRIPVDWGTASARTKYKYVYNMILNNNAVYDGKALIHTDHKNKLVAGLDKVSYKDARILLANQTELSSNEKIGLTPKYLLVSIENEDMAYDLTTPAKGEYNNVSDFAQTWRVEPIVVKHQTDVNDWRLLADPAEIDLLELGVYMGREEPEFFTQDLPTQGYAFTNDGTKFKIRDIYAGNLVDHRGFVGSLVP